MSRVPKRARSQELKVAEEAPEWFVCGAEVADEGVLLLCGYVSPPVKGRWSGVGMDAPEGVAQQLSHSLEVPRDWPRERVPIGIL